MNSSTCAVPSDGSRSCWRSAAVSARSNRPLDAITTPLGDVSQHRVAGLLETAPRAAAGSTLGLLPDHLAAQQQSQSVLQYRGHICGQGAIGTASQVGDIHGDPAAGLQFADALREHVFEHLEVFDVAAGHVPVPNGLLVLLARKVRRGGDHESHRVVLHVAAAVHVASVTRPEPVHDRGRFDTVVAADFRHRESVVERRRVVALPPPHTEGGGGGAPPGRTGGTHSPPARAADPAPLGRVADKSRAGLTHRSYIACVTRGRSLDLPWTERNSLGRWLLGLV